MPARTNYEAEIHELHDFFAAWFNGSLSNTEASFARLSGVLAESFTFIESHQGRQLSRDEILGSIRAGHGSRPDMRITIEDVRLLHEIGDTLIASYIERQSTSDTETTRRSTVVFVPQSSAPNGLVWRHVHETWITRS